MKKNTHPKWHSDCAVTCICGNAFTTGSTLQSMQIDICNKCHPFFTGEMKFVDRQGRVDKFLKKMTVAQKKKQDSDSKKAKKGGNTKKKNIDAKSYKQILLEQRQKMKSGSSKKSSSEKSTKENSANKPVVAKAKAGEKK